LTPLTKEVSKSGSGVGQEIVGGKREGFYKVKTQDIELQGSIFNDGSKKIENVESMLNTSPEQLRRIERKGSLDLGSQKNCGTPRIQMGSVEDEDEADLQPQISNPTEVDEVVKAEAGSGCDRLLDNFTISQPISVVSFEPIRPNALRLQ